MTKRRFLSILQWGILRKKPQNIRRNNDIENDRYTNIM